MTTLTTTSAVAAKAALVAAIRARPEAVGVQVSYGYPKDLSTNDIIAVMSIPNGEQTVRAAGHARREETYSIEIICSAFSGTNDQQEVTERAVELATIVELALQDNPNLSGSVINAQVDGAFQIAEADPRSLKQNGRVTEYTLTVNCDNRAYA